VKLRLAVVAAVVIALAGCSTSPSTEPELASDPPLDRAVSITTTACGHASKTSGAGVIVDNERVLASAHVVIGAASIAVTPVDGASPALVATVSHLDPRTDLAVLDVDGLDGEPIELAAAQSGDTVFVIGGGPSAPFATTIDRHVEVRIEEVRSATRSSRFGFELDHRVMLGDSGAGVFDNRGRLVAIIYGRSQGRADASFAVRKSEIDQALQGQAQSWRCDPALHRIVEPG